MYKSKIRVVKSQVDDLIYTHSNESTYSPLSHFD